MEKLIAIGGKNYSMKASAYTQFKYKNDTGRRLLTDLQQISKLQNLSDEELINNVDGLTEVLLRIAYVMIEESGKTATKGFDEFLKDVDNLYEDTKWINEVVELAASPLSRGIQKNKIDKQ